MSDITFESLGIQETIVSRLQEAGITSPTAVQAQAIPVIFEGTSVAFQSETGTGKTFAYLLPLLQQLENDMTGDSQQKKDAKLIIAAPTHELASQIKTQVQMITTAKTALLIGGAPLKRQIETLKEKPQIVIGSASRLLELYHLKKLKLDGVHALVLDEVDRLLAPELRDDTASLVKLLGKAQLIANSATITKKTAAILAESHGSAVETLFLPPEDVLKKRITHIAVFAEQRNKIDTLRKILSAEKPAKALIFTSRVDQVANITVKLKYHNVECAGLHAKTDKQERKATIDRFRSGKCQILITSDLTSRGLDIPDITHVIQMDVPSNDDFFVHRAGRTARAGKTGVNIVIGDAYEMRKFASLEKRLGITVYPRILYKGKLTSPEPIETE
ncbi:MAG: DEAD/DEAH box helicase [Treponema sp.]|nr:DEAD/DEAH box helicase [Treponema sp.]